MKKLFSTVITIALALNTFAVSVSAAEEATPTSAAVFINGNPVTFDAYNIDGNNYFKLRDIAYTLNGLPQQFDIGWNSLANAIILTSGKPYTIVGGEMSAGTSGSKTPIPTNSKIIKDGVEKQFTAYSIDDNNYFKLRDIGSAFNFSVDWDSENNAIVIDTGKNYISFYESDPDVPDFGAICNVPIRYSNLEGGSSLYDYNLSTLTSVDAERYVKALEQAGFEPYASSKGLYVYKKGERSVMMSIMDDIMALLIETGQF